MTAKIVTFGISKGGCSKSTSSGITSYLLSRNERVLAVDMDMQGNLTSLLTGEYDICNVFEKKTTLEAILEENAEPYIINVKENLDLLPSNDYLAILPGELMKRRMNLRALENALKPVMEKYDWIIIDTPPALSEHTLMPLCVRSESGSYAVIMFDGSMFAYFAIPKFLEIVDEVNNRFNSELRVAGILFSLIDQRAKENEPMKETIDEDYPRLRFNTIIRRKAATRRLALDGFENNKELDSALEHYKRFVRELKDRVSKKESRINKGQN
ncbi:ParA family protein [Caldibacillus thermoamylovorans]|uniref:ParA family protein n=1 Tax=Caldibacillus thermoamylovorans TaxID=35841 RepID=UPI001D098E08|nr:ParA family protein [Caldibacillus thermoamylovorans]MCB5936853.1 ParA family protein [Bacillus sp. DFI.2.34]MCB7078497.1 ParA family protein [Caldibacillus thermoamylovorans]